MGRLIVCNIMSVDGYYSSVEGNPLVLPMDAGFDAYNLERLRAADRLLLGANSYRMLMGFWPSQATNPEASDTNREFGRIYDQIPTTVVSDSLTAEEVGARREQTTVVPRAQAHAHLKDLKANTARDIICFASRVTWNDLVAAGLVDELHLIAGATALGNGTPIFTAPVSGLTLTESKQLAGSSNVLLRYTLTS